MTHVKEAPHAPDVLIANAGTVFVFCPLTSRAKDWIDEHVESELWQWFGKALVVETRLAGGLADGMIGDGLVLQ